MAARHQDGCDQELTAWQRGIRTDAIRDWPYGCDLVTRLTNILACSFFRRFFVKGIRMDAIKK
ncbi:hypothetical protein [Paenibacillus glycinis]|uniref:Uncharacterized protein n=1 Tax=Paenibacillus glycinis TaxID=2697035 RepID=A0ABW9XSW3_9BACL|nr:hypothetical protein [Paenibacillus glycinis]NBD25729.1 hypothetical protein [Paenibacillus glycinis]